jgi:hypothetical protein
MVTTYVRMVAFQYAVLRGAITQLRKGEEGMTTLEVLVITAGLVGLAAAAVVVITNVANSKSKAITSPTVVLST